MLTFSVQSGSNGNCIYVEAGDTRLLFDAGVAGRHAEGRMRVHDRDIRQVDALIISHDHNDHVRCCGVLHRKFKLPVWMTSPTHAAVRCDLGPMQPVNYFASGETLRFKDVLVHTLPTPHDAADGVAFVVEHAGKRLGILTDLGHPFDALCALMPTLDAMYLESNYDPHMLENGPYPYYLKNRIAGRQGHLSNQESAEVLRRANGRLQWAVLSHLSAENNTPQLAMETHRRTVGATLPLQVASREFCSDLLTL